ncbi:glycosyl transferase [Psychromonas sp. B3M02]|uniref:stealth family protein n=1 Tax=Psychromonas sp. B3M02 TaxID=2267226 RepID=UPI000DEBBB67|nr:stealth family protein [Psychromonas sp. B3M02]RBW45602.1 glycosyl transferase [Psychromonas sp. B3M02]
MTIKIDFVIPWVDPNDPDWQADKNKYMRSHAGDSSNKRFNDLETLRYVFRSIEKNCPWYNKIFLITRGHIPQWLRKDHPNLVIIKHEELYFNNNHLPTFNSSSIEMNLPNLRGLSEQFIYLNDDFIIINQIKRDRFFVNCKPVDFLSHGWVKRGILFKLCKGHNTWVNALNNCLKLINNDFKIKHLSNQSLYHSSYGIKNKVSNFMLKNIYKQFIWLEHWHNPQPYLFSSLQKAKDTFSTEMSICSKNKFRKDNDLTQYIYRYWHLASNSFHPYKHNDGYVLKIKNLNYLTKGISYIKKRNSLNFVCFNDQMTDITSDKEFDLIKTTLLNFLDNILIERSSFEK